ncbi:MAG: response regulator, partial [Planctomycetes bacterium]|nr:response regulator [Planctomycetota bacterium]
ITVDAKGEILELKNTINTMVDQLNGFAGEVTRVAREVGTDGKLGGQAIVKGVAGVWKDLTDNVNQMGANLTTQVRGIAKVVTSVANGDLKRKLVLEAKGEIAELAETINNMIDTLAVFGAQVTSVAREVGIEGRLGGQAHVPGAAGLWRDLTDNVNQLAGNLTTQVRAIAEVATAVARGDLTRSILVEAAGEVATLKDNVNQMIGNLKETTRKNTEQDWLKTNLAKFTRMLQGQRDLLAVSRGLLSEVAPLVGALHGAFYVLDAESADKSLKLLGSYAFKERKGLSNRFRPGEGLVGQCAFEKERILLTNVPPDYIQVSSALGEAPPANIVVLPVVFEGQVKAVIELAGFGRFSDVHLTFLEQLTESVGIVLNTIEATMRTEELLKQSQALTEELQSQQEELTETNKRLEEQARTLRESEDLLKTQQTDLQAANEELEERTALLEEQKTEVERKNREVGQAKRMLEEKAAQLALTSKYKSEFLANMSHELRTPLNSLLILARILAENTEANLTAKQVEYAQTIQSSGSDLLELINDILDLAKIESGTMAVDLANVVFLEMQAFVERTFRQVAENRKLAFEIELAPGLPPAMNTDGKRLQQVVKNLLSNAFKFTERGGVTLSIAVARSGWAADHEVLSRVETVVAFSVADTGIGIPADKHRIIFEAFQQVDSGTARKYGGTGLGLSISREIVQMLGGEIHLESEMGVGSTFTVYLPLVYSGPVKGLRGVSGVLPRGAPTIDAPADSGMRSAGEIVTAEGEGVAEAPFVSMGLEDDRGRIRPGDRVLLVVEDDRAFAKILLDLARERGFKALHAPTAIEALRIVRETKPTAITLDIHLPDWDGWTVLDRLKSDPATRHIPVHVITVETDPVRGLRSGAFAFLTKPVTKEALDEAFGRLGDFLDRKKKRVLVVEDQPVERNAVVELLGNGDVETVAVATGAEALAALSKGKFDCLVLDLGLPDMPGKDLLRKMVEELGLRDLPVIVYTGRDLSREDEKDLTALAQSIIVKGARSPERLLAETALFLHRVESSFPAPKRRLLEQARQVDPILSGRTALVVDDDIRNIFALTTVLERRGIQVVYAENGRDAIATLEKTPDVDVVLMDIMMPAMDGWETTRQIRKNPVWKKLPVLALTAKAMKGDRERCLEAGCSDYLPKPVDVDQLLSLLRVWLYR